MIKKLVIYICYFLFAILIFLSVYKWLVPPTIYHLPATVAIEEKIKDIPVLNKIIPVEILEPKLAAIQTIDDVFSQHQIIDFTKVVTIMATGDVLTARTVNSIATQRNDFTWPFLQTASVLRAADITFINLETPLIANCPVKTDGMVFCGNLQSVKGLQFAGIDVVTMANNHATNQGQDGILQTKQALEQAGLLVTGVNGPVYTTVKGTRIAFLGFNDVGELPGISSAKEAIISQQIQEAKMKADVVVVEFHWGVEYTRQPTSRQISLAHFTIDQGADLVLGNHPHWYQPPEMYKGKLIMYSHGNFVFDQMWSEETRVGIVGAYTFQGNTLVNVSFLPIKIEAYGQPRFMEGQEKESVIQSLKAESQKLATSAQSVP